jgi:site-specific DNA recombinase
MAAKRVGIYTRISKDKNGESVSPARQEALCRQRAEENGWTIVNVFSDRGISGWRKGVKRPAWDSLLDAVRRHEVDVIMAYSLSRLGRRTADILDLSEWLKEHGAGFTVYDNPDIDTTTAAGTLMLTMLSAVNQMQSDTASEAQKSAKKVAAMQGKMPAGGRRQFGYTKGATPVIVAEEAAIVRESSERIRNGESARRVAMSLNERCVKTTTGGDWGGGTLAQMLRSPRLAGWRKTAEGLVQGAWEPVLSDDEWTTLCAALDGSPKRGGGINTKRHLLTSLVKCGNCGHNLYAHFSRRQGHVMDRYVCSNSPGSNSCGHLAVSKHSVEEYVKEQFVLFMASVQVTPEDQVEQSLAEVEAGIEETRANLRRITRAHYIDGRMPEDVFNEAHDELAERLARFERARESAASRLAKRANLLRPGSQDDIDRWWSEASLEDRRSALAKAIDKVVVDPAKVRGGNKFDTDRVRITWSWEVYERSNFQTGMDLTLSPDDPESVADVQARIKRTLQGAPAAAIAASAAATKEAADLGRP